VVKRSDNGGVLGNSATWLQKLSWRAPSAALVGARKQLPRPTSSYHHFLKNPDCSGRIGKWRFSPRFNQSLEVCDVDRYFLTGLPLDDQGTSNLPILCPSKSTAMVRRDPLSVRASMSTSTSTIHPMRNRPTAAGKRADSPSAFWVPIKEMPPRGIGRSSPFVSASQGLSTAALTG
jgi:hypothetical protein